MLGVYSTPQKAIKRLDAYIRSSKVGSRKTRMMVTFSPSTTNSSGLETERTVVGDTTFYGYLREGLVDIVYLALDDDVSSDRNYIQAWWVQ